MSRPVLKVKVLSIAHLPKTDVGFWASCDAFVCLELNGQKAQTTHVNNSYDPTFNQVFTLTLKEDVEMPLKIVVMDKDFTTNEEVGQAAVPVSSALTAGPVVLNLTDKNGSLVIGKSRHKTEVRLYLEVVVKSESANVGHLAMSVLTGNAKPSGASPEEESQVGLLAPLPPRVEKTSSRSQMNHPTVELPFEKARRMRNLSPAADSPADGAMWMDKAFVGEFGDAFVQDTSLEGGHIGPSIKTFARISDFVLTEYSADMQLFSHSDKDHVRYVLEKLQGAETIENELHECRRHYPDGDSFPNFLARRAKQIQELAVGDFVIWTGGWLGDNGGHAIMHIIDKTSPSEVSFVTCNTGQGVGYHPADGTGYPKTKRRTAFRADHVGIDRMTDPGLLYVFWKCQLVGHEDHRPETIYEVVIPHMLGCTLRVAATNAAEDPYAESETLQRSGVCYYRCILCATRYSLRRRGLSQAHVKQFLHFVRRGYVVMVGRDLDQCKASCAATTDSAELPGLFPSDLRLILLSCQQLAYSAVKESHAGRLSLTQLKALSTFVGEVKSKATALPLLGDDVDMRDPAAPAASSALPCDVGGLNSIRATAQDTCDGWAGAATQPPAEPSVNQLSVPRDMTALSDGAEGTKQVLERLRAVCGELRKSSKVGSAMLQVASQIEMVFLEVIPPPSHQGPCRWKAASSGTRRSLLELLRWCSEEYTAVCRSVPTSEEMHTVRALTNVMLLAAFYQTVRSATSDAEALDAVLPAMIQDERLTLDTKTAAKEGVVGVLSERCLLRPEHAEAYSLVAQFLADVEDWGAGGQGVMYDMSFKDGKIGLTADSPVFEFVQRFNDRYCRAGADKFGPGELSPNIREFVSGRDKPEDANELQRKLAWLMLGSRGPIDFGHGCNDLIALRSMILRYKLAVQYARPGTGGGNKTFVNGLVEMKASLNKEKTQAQIVVQCCMTGIASDPYPHSPGSPRFYKLSTARREITEDDVLHKEILDNFDDSLSQEDSEYLLSLLTAPYIRIPLVVEFFACDRVGVLLNEKLQRLFRAVLFDAGPWTRTDALQDITTVPAPRSSLATPRGALSAELERAPESVLRPLISLAGEAARLSTGDCRSAFVDVLCFVVRVVARVQSYLRFVQTKGRGDAALLAGLDAELGALLRKTCAEVLEPWATQAAASGDKVLQSALHAHLAVTHWPLIAADVNATTAAALLSSVCFVMTWHLPGVGVADSGGADADQDKRAQEEKEKAVAALAKRGGLGGLCEQELFWLFTSKRYILNSWLLGASKDDAVAVLDGTLKLVTESESAGWEMAGDGLGTLQDGALVECVDAKAEFRLNVQNGNLSFKQSGLKPVPESIAKYYEFQRYFRDETPFCAEVSRNANRHAVKVLSKNMLVEAWNPLQTELFALIPGTPTIDPPPRFQVLESTHPYPPNDKMAGTVTIEGAKGLTISFDPQCRTEKGYDVLTLTIGGKDVVMSGNPSAWVGSVHVEGDCFSYQWKSDSGNMGEWDDSWGWRMNVTEQVDVGSGASKVQYGGGTFGGPGRVYKYGDEMPSDLQWVSDILDPVLHGALTAAPRNGRGPLKWKEVGRDGMQASEQMYLLPTEEMPDDACSCTLLSQEANGSYWREIRVWRGLHSVDVMVIDAFGRRAFPRQVYTNDVRFTLASTEYQTPEEPHAYPPPTAVRYESGSFLRGPMGSRNVLLTDLSDAARPMLLITDSFLQGMIPGAMVDNFTFWQDLSSGWLHGKKVVSERRDASGKTEAFTDPWFDYELEVRIDGAEGTRVVRVEDGDRCRCLVNLKAVPPNSQECDLVRLVTRLDHLSHVLAWTRTVGKQDIDRIASAEDAQIDIIELPRLRVRFAVKQVDGVLRLFSLDRTGYHVLQDQSRLPPTLLKGLSNSLLLSDAVGTLAIMICNFPLVRPAVAFCPFSTATHPQPCDWSWQRCCDMRVFVYEVHVSNEMVLFPSLGSTIYWAYSKLLHREYAASFLAIQSCSTDMPLDKAERCFLDMIAQTLDDHSPDAHACRLKLRLALMYCPMAPDQWPVGGLEGLMADFVSYVDKACHIAAACRLSADDELQLANHLLKHCEQAPRHPTVVNRKAYLDAVDAQRKQNPTVEPVDVRVPIFVSEQDDGGRFWASALSLSVERVQTYCGGNHWFSNCSFDGAKDTYADREFLEACDTARLDTMMGNKGFGYCFYAGLMGGHTTMMIGSTDCTRSIASLLIKLVLLKACKWGQASLSQEELPFHLLIASTCSSSALPQIPTLGKLNMAPTYKSQTGSNNVLYNVLVDHAKALSACDIKDSLWASSPSSAPADDSVVQRDSRRELPVYVSDYSRSQHTLVPFETAAASLSAEEVAAFGSRPLSSLIPLDDFVVAQAVSSQCPLEPPFDLSTHPDAQSNQARETLDRIREDWKAHAAKVNAVEEMAVCGITPDLLSAYEQGGEPPKTGPVERERPMGEIGGVMQVDERGIPIIQESSQEGKSSHFDSALPKLRELKVRLLDAHDRETATLNTATRSAVLRANTCKSSPDKDADRISYELMRFCTLEPVVSAEILVAALVSSKGPDDIRRLNPFLTDADVESILNSVTAIVFRANRIAQLRRAIAGTNDVIKAITTNVDGRKLRKEVEGLVGNLCGKRHFMGKAGFDPRFLLFEYLFGWLLSAAQVYLVQTFMQRLTDGGVNAHGEKTRSMVHQMIMGAGKTTCIGPLLALMLSDGQGLVTQVVPNALLAMSRNVMWGRFTQVLTKRVYTLVFTRTQAADEEQLQVLHDKMERARQSGGIVVTTPSAIKSMVNKYCELMFAVKEAPDRLVADTDANKREKRSLELERKVRAADALAKVMDLWSDRKQGVLLLDEVDMLLHPLRSELNFPIGDKYPITPAPSRWELPIHILEAVFYAGGRPMPPGRTAPQTLVNLRQVVKAGIEKKVLQNTPHLVLLDADFYHEAMMPLVAEWALSWMRSHHVFDGIETSHKHFEEYVTKGQDADEDILVELEELEIQHQDVIEILNLAHDWVTSYVPHALSKVNRVSFGLLHDKDLVVIGREQPASRLILAVPFMGKDVPSPAAEFAQPDVLIAMTIVAYNYEGLRRSDVKGVVRQLKQQLHFQAGPVQDRPANRLFEDWVASACAQKKAARNVLTLELTQLGDEREMDLLFQLLRDSPSVIAHHLVNAAFPQTMHQQRQKISSSGQELGSDILFGRRAGFSGTPSSLLPVHLTPCHFEEGSEGKILRTLTDERITMESPLGAQVSAPGQQWTVRGILDQIARAVPACNALIDVGALITGFSNEEVARHLIDTGLKSFRGCVYLDDSDEKMIYLRGAIKSVPLSECGLSVNEYFTFFDQVHTTGMDIKQALNACAVLTVGKDMTFRDYAQGAYRMRGIGKGQTIHLYVIPEVKLLIRKALGALSSGNLVHDVAAWLLLNGMRMEKLQFLQLCSQNLQNIWRHRALANLMTSSGVEGMQDVSVSSAAGGARGGLGRFHGKEEVARALRESVEKMVDVVDFDVPKDTSKPESFVDSLVKLYDCSAGGLVTTDGQLKTKEIVFQQARDATATTATEEAQTKLGSEMTREKEREQEQQKQKQQQQQNEMQFAPNEGEQTPWDAALLFQTPQAASSDNAPLYRLSGFSPRPKDFSWQNSSGATVTINSVSPLAFPSSVLQSNNFAPLDRDLTAPLRLKNVTLVADWLPDARDPDSRVALVVTLSEAEAIRALIHRHRGGLGDGAMALVVVSTNKVLDATVQYKAGATEGPMLTTNGACVRFWNNDMFLSDTETQLLLGSLTEADMTDRREFFEAAMAARRRSKQTWVDAPIRKVFMFTDDEALLAMIALITRLQAAIKARGLDLVRLCEAMDRDGDGFLSIPEIQRVLQHLDPTVDLPALQRLVALMDEDGDNAIEYCEFERMFAGGFSSAAEGLTSMMSQRPHAVKSFGSIFSAAPGAKSLTSQAKRDNAARRREEREREDRVQREREEAEAAERAAAAAREEERRRSVEEEERRRLLMEEQERIQRQRAEDEQGGESGVESATSENAASAARSTPTCSKGHAMTQEGRFKRAGSGGWQCFVCRQSFLGLSAPLWKCADCADRLCKRCAPK